MNDKREYKTIQIGGASYQNGTYVQLNLSAREMTHLAQCLEASCSTREPILTRLGAMAVEWQFGRDVGLATMEHPGRIVIVSNSVDMRSLARELQAFAYEERSDDSIPHVHLEPVYIVPSSTVSDVVFNMV